MSAPKTTINAKAQFPVSDRGHLLRLVLGACLTITGAMSLSIFQQY